MFTLTFVDIENETTISIWELEFFVKKVEYVWSSHFPEAITTNMQIGNDSCVFKYPVTCKQKILNSHKFY